MRIISLSSSSSVASLTLWEKSEVTTARNPVPRGHVEFIHQSLQNQLAEAGWSMSSIDLLAVDCGPGSFTGVRVAVSTFRSFCWALDRPLFIESSLDLLLDSAAGPTVAAINAYKNLLFVKYSLDGLQLSEAQVLSPMVLETALAGLNSSWKWRGDGFQAYKPLFSPAFSNHQSMDSSNWSHPSSQVLARRASRSQPGSWTSDWKSLIPLYLRESAAEESLKTKL